MPTQRETVTHLQNCGRQRIRALELATSHALAYKLWRLTLVLVFLYFAIFIFLLLFLFSLFFDICQGVGSFALAFALHHPSQVHDA